MAAVDEAVELLKESGVKRMIPLNVSGPFHTALLRPASEQLAQALEEVEFADFQVELVGNTEAKVMKKRTSSPLDPSSDGTSPFL